MDVCTKFCGLGLNHDQCTHQVGIATKPAKIQIIIDIVIRVQCVLYKDENEVYSSAQKGV